jgi:hypothetical protein
MKSRTSAVIGLAVLTLIVVLWQMPRKEDAGRRADAPPGGAQVDVPRNASQPSRASASTPDDGEDLGEPPSRRNIRTSPRAARPPATIRVDAAHVLATVNQTPIQLHHLMSIAKGEEEVELTREQFKSRLERAIEMELTAQAAHAWGVTLTTAQQQRVVRLADEHQASLEFYREYGVSWSTASPDAVEFEQRVLMAQMMEQNLVAHGWSVFPSPDPEMQLRYEQARHELLQQLASSATITRGGPVQ